ncbi:MAG: prepilin-type N-terminal cleavage/methylation domain-containing protein [Planctomycetales bacterium]|nr:prepilin-type N-terminal cleavage/methylation domain-containing protein [Planctomycetales bacterium]
MTSQRKKSLRFGFTLVELIVVLMIIVGLAAILIPAVTDMVARTNASSSSSNISEVANAIQRYETQFLSYPDNLDGLMTDLTGTDLDTLSAGLTAATVDVTLTAATRVPLTVAGITSVGIHTAGDITFDPATPTALTDTTVLKGLTAAAQVSLGIETTGTAGKYVVLGVGAISDMNGKTTIDAPVYFPEDGSLNPDTIYGRFIAVFQITDGTNPLTRAKLVTVITPTGQGLNTGLSNYFDLTTQN